MQVPDRLLRAVRPSEHPGLLFATAYGTAVLSVAPFLLPALADRYDISLGLASLATAGQLAGFTAGSWGAGRFLNPRGRVLGFALVAALTVNALSALLPLFALLVGLRVLSGLALGVITWFSWAQVFGDESRMGSVAVIGPLVGITTAPVAARIIEEFGVSGIFVALAVTAVVPLAFARRSGSADEHLIRTAARSTTVRHAATAEAKRVLVSLGLLTLGGSAVFTFGAVIALERTDLSLGAVALAYSANALASIPSARWTGRRGIPGLWLFGCALCALAMGTSTVGGLFVLAMVGWGFFFWMGVPGAYALLARCSHHPRERAGDAQAIMAAGRVFGPLAGGAVLSASGAAALGALGGAFMASGAVLLVAVDRHVRN